MTRALVVGLGSIGTRHRRVLTELGLDVRAVSRRGGDGVHATIAEAVDAGAPDYVVIASATAEHEASVRELTAAGYRGLLLVEKPLAVAPALLSPFSRVGVGFNLRFHPVLRELHDRAAERRILTIEASTGQALEQWRPDRPVREQYSASRAAGGGVLRDLSHELDYLRWIGGPLAGIFGRGGRFGEATVDADDAWSIIARLERAPLVSVQLDYLDTVPRRRIVITTDRGSLVADLIAGTLIVDGTTAIYETDRDATYRELHRAMLADDEDVATAADAAAIDEAIEAIEASAASGSWTEMR